MTGSLTSRLKVQSVRCLVGKLIIYGGEGNAKVKFKFNSVFPTAMVPKLFSIGTPPQKVSFYQPLKPLWLKC